MTGASSKKSDYAGDLSPKEAWALLEREPNAALIDVRTKAEWSFVGIPDLSPLGRDAHLIEWQSFPAMTVDPNFMARLQDALGAPGEATGRTLLFLCRSGARSRSAAIAATAAGYGTCFNIDAGFEGNLDQERHRGRLGGWKASGLPWVQT